MKENAAWALGYIGKHSEQLAGLVVDAGTLPLLVLTFQEPELSLKQVGIHNYVPTNRCYLCTYRPTHLFTLLVVYTYLMKIT